MALGDLSSGLYLGRLFGVAVRVHASWLLIFVLLLISLATQVLPLMDLAQGGPWWSGLPVEERIVHFERQFAAAHKDVMPPRELVDEAFGIQRWPVWQYWALGALGSLGLFLCVLAHELGHSIVARAAGMRVEGITLFIFGGVSRLSDEPPSARVEFRVAIIGPLISLILGAVCGGLWYGLAGRIPTQALSLLFYFGFINVLLGVFNLLPGFPLDGGRVLRSILWGLHGSLRRATSVATTWGRLFGAFFIALGVIQLFVTRDFSALWMIFIGLFLRYAAGAAWQQMAVRDALTGLTVRGLLQDKVVTVTPGLSLERLVDDFFFKHRFRSFPVLDGDRFVGMVSLKDVQAVPRANWPAAIISQAMHQIREENVVHPDDDLLSVFRKMTEAEKGHLPVVENGRLVGIVTRHDIMDLLHVRLELGGDEATAPRG
jgi:Zn-dependent protease